MRVLFSTGSALNYMAPPQLGGEQINCGPDWPDRTVDGRIVSLASPVGVYDLAALSARLPAAQQPDVVVCLVDAARRNLPANLRAFRCPKVLLVADTHHVHAPVTQMMRYAASEPFDRIVFLYDRHHVDFFRSAGLKNLFWFPGLTFPHGDSLVQGVRQDERISQIAFVGQAGAWHPRRTRLLPALRESGVRIEAAALSQKEGLALYGRSSVGFNASLNSDLNLRVFEILASGALLLTDRLAPDAGLGTLLREGREMITYGSVSEMQDLARQVVQQPAETAGIARAGQEWFDHVFNEERRKRGFASLVADGKAVPEFALSASRSSIWFGGVPAPLKAATRVYEVIQELHRTQEIVRVAIDESGSDDFERMCATLPRIQVERGLVSSVDLLVVSRNKLAGVSLAEVSRIWVCDGNQSAISRLMAQAGLLPLDRELALFGREVSEISAALSPGQRAWQFLESGDYGSAMEAAKTVLAGNARDLDALLTITDLSLEAGNREMASRLLRSAQQLAPRDPRVAALSQQLVHFPRPALLANRLLNTGRQAIGRKDWRGASAFVGKALQVDPKIAGGQALLGLVLSELGDYSAADTALRQAIKAEETAEVWRHLAVVQLKLNKSKDAIVALRHALRIDPASVESLHLLADTAALIRDGSIEDEATQLLRKLDISSPKTQLHLGNMLKRQGRLVEALDSHCNAVGGKVASSAGRGSGKQRVAFLVQHGPSWSGTESVWRAFCADPAWETVIIAMPYLHPLYGRADDSANAIFGFLSENSIPHIRWDNFSLKPNCVDVLFIQNPYDVTRPAGWRVPELLRCVRRLAYIPYGIEIGGGEENAINQYNQLTQQLSWAVFARSERHRGMYAKHCLTGAAHVHVTGHPKMDALRNLSSSKDPELTEFVGGRRSILWNPQFDVRQDSTAFGRGYSTFMRWYEFMLAEFARRPDLAFIIRPHPLFFSTLESRGILSREAVNTWLDQCAAAGNVHIDLRPSYVPAFAAADALLSDASSFLLEYASTGKPLLYLHNPQGPALNEDGVFVREYCATAETEREISAFIDAIAVGDDPKAEARKAAYSEFMHLPAIGAGAAIKQAVEARLEAEATEGSEYKVA